VEKPKAKANNSNPTPKQEQYGEHLVISTWFRPLCCRKYRTLSPITFKVRFLSAAAVVVILQRAARKFGVKERA
jgi:hypothetical protein